ncbi:MAG: polyphosphate kinase 2 family protein [Acidimicrobiales bacterium]
MFGRETDRWRAQPGATVDLSGIDPASTEGAPGGKKETEATFGRLHEELLDLQERLWAERRQSLLVVLQAMDAGGKDGTVKHLYRGLNPVGARVISFRVPTEEELAHDFLWRVHKQTPARGEVVLFNRSHYEDVLVVRVHSFVPEDVWRPRYGLINAFETHLAAAGTRVIKFFLHISPEEQAARFRARLADPTTRWKFRKGDLDERALWPDYVAAYTEALERTSTETAPWYIVPADRKWYRNWAISQVILDTLEEMNPQYPPGEDLEGIVIQ